MSSGKSGSAGKSHDYYGSIAGETNCERLDFIWGILRDDKIVWPDTKVWAAGTWAANSVVVYNGRLYETPSSTSATPPNSPWVLFRRNRVDVSNPFKITITDLGEAFLYWGTPTQTLDTVDEQFLNNYGHPPYRWRAVLALKKCLFGTEVQTAPNITVLGGRAPRQSVVTGSSAQLDADWQANPWCVIAELLTHPVIGLGIPDALLDSSSFQAEADWCYGRSSTTYISPLYDAQTSVRSIIPDILDYIDGFVFWNAAGKLQAGHWPHQEAPPSFTSANTLDQHDLTDEVQWGSDGFKGTGSAVVVNFRDIEAAFQSVPAQASNVLNRRISGRANTKTIDRPFIVRASQAAAVAAEAAKVDGEPFFKGTLTARAEKSASVTPGSLFQLTDDILQVTRVARCTGRTISAPPSGTAKIDFESERGISDVPYQATPANPGAEAKPSPARITDFQIIQIPDALADNNSFHVACLAARNNAVTTSLAVWWKQADSSDYEQLGTINGFAVAGTMNGSINGADVSNEVLTGSVTLDMEYNTANTDIWNLTLQSKTGAGAWTDRTEGSDYVIDYTAGSVFILSGAGITAGDSIRVTYSVYAHVTLSGSTPAGDIEAISAAQTEDEVNNNTLLMFVFNASNEKKFEIMSVRSVEAVGGGSYNVKIRRNAYGTKTGGDGSHVWTTSDRVFLIFRSSLFPLDHASFEDVETVGDTAAFRLAPSSAWVSADVGDVYDAGTNPSGLTTQFNYTFNDPYAPTVSWKVLQKNGTNISDFTVTFLTTDEFEFTFQLDDANGDLSSARLVARLGATELLLWSQILSGFTSAASTTFKIQSEGDWQVVAVVSDRSGRVIEYPLTAVGGGSEVLLMIRNSGSTSVATPTLRTFPRNSCQLVCTTSGATIKYQIVALYAAPGGSWTTYTGAFTVTAGKTVYAYALKAGMTDSAVVSWNFP